MGRLFAFVAIAFVAGRFAGARRPCSEKSADRTYDVDHERHGVPSVGQDHKVNRHVRPDLKSRQQCHKSAPAPTSRRFIYEAKNLGVNTAISYCGSGNLSDHR